MRKRYSRSYTVLSFLTMFSYREQPFGGSPFIIIVSIDKGEEIPYNGNRMVKRSDLKTP